MSEVWTDAQGRCRSRASKRSLHHRRRSTLLLPPSQRQAERSNDVHDQDNHGGQVRRDRRPERDPLVRNELKSEEHRAARSNETQTP